MGSDGVKIHSASGVIDAKWTNEIVEGTVNLVDGLEVIDGRILGKVPVDEFTSIRTRSIHTQDGSDTLMLGKYEGTTLPDGTIDWTKAGPNWLKQQIHHILTWVLNGMRL